MAEIEALHPDAEITHLDGVSVDYDGLALQRAAVEYRTTAPAEPRVAGFPRETWRQSGTSCLR